MESNSCDISRLPPSMSYSLKRNSTKLPYWQACHYFTHYTQALVLHTTCLPDKVGLHQKGVNQTWHSHKAHYKLSVKLRDFTVWRHSSRKISLNCAVLTGNIAGLKTVLSSRLSHRELRSSLRKSHSFLSSPAAPRRHHLKVHRFLPIHSADEHRMIYFFSNTTSYSISYAFFSFFSDNITADVASKQQTTASFLSNIVTSTRRNTELTKKKWQTWWETCAVPENIQFSFSYTFFFHS